MHAPILLTILIVALTQIGGVLGGLFLIWKEQLAHRLSTLLLSFAAGTLLGVAFLDLLPETAETATDMRTVFYFVLFGILLFFLIEKLLLWHHHAHDEAYDATNLAEETHIGAPAVRGKHIRPLVLFGDGLHNALDGVTLAITFSLDWRLGLLTALAVFFHEVPHNISDFAILLHTHMERRKVFWWNIALALPSPAAALITLLTVGNLTRALTPLLSLAAGSFLYIALADLMPEIHHERRPARILLQVILLLFGVAVMWQLGRVFPKAS